MTPFLQLALTLLILVSAAKIGGYISYRLGQPSVLGELITGIILGPSILDVFHLPYFSDTHLLETVYQLAELGVLFLMFLAGLELHLTDLAKAGKTSALAGSLGVIFPIILGFLVGKGFSLNTDQSIFIGLVLSATSVSISAQTLMELKVLRSRVGISLLGSAVLDDILVVLGLSIFTALVDPEASGGFITILWIILRMALFLGITTLVGTWILPKVSKHISEAPVSQGLIAFSVVMLLLFGWLAEVLGNMAAITGAFLAGVILARSPVKERIQSGISALAYSFFVPIFFIDVGLNANMRQLTGENLWFFVGIATVAVIGKVLGSGLGALASGLTRHESLQIGIGMISRGEVGLIVASVGISSGLVSTNIFSAFVGMVIFTTLITPPLLRAAFLSTIPSKGLVQETKILKSQELPEGEEE